MVETLAEIGFFLFIPSFLFLPDYVSPVHATDGSAFYGGLATCNFFCLCLVWYRCPAIEWDWLPSEPMWTALTIPDLTRSVSVVGFLFYSRVTTWDKLSLSALFTLDLFFGPWCTSTVGMNLRAFLTALILVYVLISSQRGSLSSRFLSIWSVGILFLSEHLAKCRVISFVLISGFCRDLVHNLAFIDIGGLDENDLETRAFNFLVLNII